MIELICDKNRAFFRETEKLTSGSIGVTINFVFSPEWDDLLKTAVFEAGDVKNDVILTSKSCEIPPEVLAIPGKQLLVGVFGELADKTLVIPTIYAEAGTIKPGASPSGMTSAPPSPSWPEQVQAIALEAKEVANSVLTDAELGKFNGKNGTDGGWYTPAVTQPDANTMRVSFEPSKEGMPAVADTDVKLPTGGGGGGGEDGGYYTPAVTLTSDDTMRVEFSASKADMPAVAAQDIILPAGPTGPKGDAGDTGPQGPKGEAGADGAPGTDGKSAYQYAQEGGYTGTEAAFAAKLAAEKFANPNALTFTGAVTGSYDGSEPLTVEIPGGGGEETELPIMQEYTIEGDETASIVFTGLPNISEFLLKIAWSWQSNSYSGVVRVSFHETLSGYNHRVGRITGVSTGSTEEIIIKGRPIAKNGEIVVLSAVATASRDVNESLSVSALTSTSVISVWWADSGKYFPAGTTVSLRGK